VEVAAAPNLTRTGTQWVATGASDHQDAWTAGAAAVREALAGDDAKLLIVFASGAYDLQALLRGIEAVAHAVPHIGCSTSGEIAADGPGTSGVVVMALGGSGFSIATAAARAGAGGLRAASAEVASAVERLEPRPHKVLLLLSDGLGGDQQDVVRGAFRVLGAEVPLVGGCAGDDLKMQATFQFHGGAVLQQAVVGAAIGSERPIGIGVQHGWRKVGEPMVVTASDSNRVLTLDDQPALAAYLRRLDAPADAASSPEAFTRFALTHPLGLSRRTADEVRFVAGADFADGSLTCIAEVPQGSLTWLMEGDRDSVLAATDVACAQAVESLDGQPPMGLLAFDCIARKGVLGDDGIRTEVERIAEFAGGAPVAGFYTYGEIARTRSVNGFHNQTLVVVAFS
jgi:hypothetical protein